MTPSTHAIKLFVSYSHDDEPYFKVFNEGIKKVVKNSQDFEWSIWEDTQIHVGSFWDGEIQSNIQNCNVALLLVSVGFMASTYIREKEYAEFIKRYEEKGILIVPIVFAPCDFTKWEDLSRLQFFKPSGADYEKATLANFTYADLIKFRETDGMLIPNTNINRYHLKLIEKIEASYKEFLSRTAPAKVEFVPTLTEKKLSDAPKPKAYFTGRENELEEFRKAIEANVNLIAIDGPGGIGKTQFTSRCIEKFIPADKVIWYDCTTASQLDTLISEAGYPELLKGSNKKDRDKFSAFKDKIQENGLYLFLDNFQETNNNPVFKQFLEFIHDYLKAGCVIVLDRDDIRTGVFTPKRIHIEGFKEKRLEYAKALIDFAYKDEINITDENLDNLCAQLQGYPLAIDFAIYLLSQGETPDDILTKIVNETEVSQISERLLNAIFERPDATNEEKDFMRQFSVFIGGVTSVALTAVISETTVTAAARKLQKKNLLTYSHGLYTIHPLVREFCYKELSDKKSVHAKVAEYYIQQRPPQNSQQLNPGLEELVFYHLEKSEQWERVEKEIEENGRQFILFGQVGLVKELLDKLKEIDIEKPIFDILYGDIAELQGKWDEAQKHYDKARLQDGDIHVKAEGLVKYGEMTHKKGSPKEALIFYEQVHEFSLQNNLKREEARALNDIGLVLDILGDLDNALKKINEALELRKEINDKQGVASSLGNIASLYNTQGNISKALEFYHLALNIDQEIENKQGIAGSLSCIGAIYETLGNTSKAMEYHQSSLKLEEEIGSKQGIASCLASIGGIYYTQGDTQKALEYHQSSLNIDEEIGNKQGIAASLGSIGRIYETMGETNQAMDYFKRSLTLREEIGIKQEIAVSYGSIGSIYSAKGDTSKALAYHQRSLNIDEEIGNKQGIAASLGSIGSVYHAKGENAKALEYHQRSLCIEEEIGHKHGIAVTLGNLGLVYQKLNNFTEALNLHERALLIKKEIGNKKEIAVTLLNLGTIHSHDRKRDYNSALLCLFNSLALFNEIGAKPDSTDASLWIINIRNKTGLHKFKTLALEAFGKLAPEIQKYIPLNELIQEPVQRTEPKIGRNDRVSVRYTNGSVKKDVKFKSVEDDFNSGKCELI